MTVMILMLFLSVACHQSYNDVTATSTVHSTTPTAVVNLSSSPQSKPALTSEKIAKVKDGAQMVDIRSLNKNIVLDIRYATENNFTKRKLYPVARCVLRFSVAKKLLQVQEDLAQKKLGLKAYDCYRPLSVQKLMWKVLPDARYLANPAKGSRHNRGAAVDITLVDTSGKELEMPSAFDNFTPASHVDYPRASTQAKKNRELLEKVMRKHGFVGTRTEWWHFDAVGWEKFSVMDVPLDSIPPA